MLIGVGFLLKFAVSRKKLDETQNIKIEIPIPPTFEFTFPINFNF